MLGRSCPSGTRFPHLRAQRRSAQSIRADPLATASMLWQAVCMPAKSRAVPPAAPEESALAASIDRLSGELRMLTDVLEEIRVEFQWLTNNGLPMQAMEHVVVHKMGLDPYAADFHDKVELARYSYAGDITASPLDSQALDRIVD